MASYTFTDFAIPGSSRIEPRGINSSGEVVGYYVDTFGQQHGFTYGNGTLTPIDVTGATGTGALAINASGEVVGNYSTSPYSNGAYADIGGTLQAIVIPGGVNIVPFSVNDAGQITGSYSDSSGTHGFIYKDGQYTSFDYSGNVKATIGLHINNAGEVAGAYEDQNYIEHTFLYNAGDYLNIAVPGSQAGTTTIAGLNNLGMVTGSFQDAAKNTYGYVENNGVYTTFGVPGAAYVQPEGINDAGTVVGYYIDGANASHGFVEQNGVVTVVDDAKHPNAIFYAINDAGVIAGLSESNFIDTPFTATLTPPSITGTLANQATSGTTAIAPFAKAVVADPNGGTETLTIALSGGGGTLSGSGLVRNADGTYTLSGSAAAVTGALEALAFTPAQNAPGTTTTTTFTLTDNSSAGTSTTDATTSVVDMVAPVPPPSRPSISGTLANQATSGTTAIAPFAKAVVADPNGGTETLTIALSGGGGTLSGSGLVRNADGTYTLSGSAAAVTGALEALAFTPAQNAPGTTTTTTFTLTDNSSADTSTTDATTSVVDMVAPVPPPSRPSITGTAANQATSGTTAIAPFAKAAVADPNGGTETLTIALSGGGGTLSGSGLVRNADGTYTLSGSAAAVTGALEALAFTPAQNAPGTTTTTTFTLTDSSSAGTSTTDATTSVVDTVAPVPPPSPTPPTDTVSFDVTARYLGEGAFVFTGQAASTAGVGAVEIVASVDGVTTDLGAATLDANGTFSFVDQVGAHRQSSIVAVLTDKAGSGATASAPFTLTGGIEDQPFQAEQDDVDPATGAAVGSVYSLRDGLTLYRSDVATNADGSTSYTYSHGVYFGRRSFSAFTDTYGADGAIETHVEDGRDGTHKIDVLAPGQTVTAIGSDTIDASGQHGTSFVFDPGFGQDTITGFTPAGRGHDTITLSSADFADLGEILRQTRNSAAGAVIHDRVSGDTILVAGVSKADLFAHGRQNVALQG